MVGTAYFVELSKDGILAFAKEYNLITFGSKDIADAINCIVFTKLVIAEAKKLSKED